MPAAAEGLLTAVRRLRTLHTKVVAFGQGRVGATGFVDVADLVSSLRDELQQMQLGLELCWEPPTGLPRIACAPDVVRDAMLFLSAALVRVERGATHFSILAEPCFACDDPRVQIELSLEWVTERSTPTSDHVTDASFTLDLEAANNLVSSHGGEISLWRLPGRAVRVVVWWPAEIEGDETAAVVGATERDGQAEMSHRYGGALLLEADPAIRAMLASELKATGRAVFACADIASARSFLEATPDRFELLIVDQHERLGADRELQQAIRTLAPELKVCVLGRQTGKHSELWPHLHHIEKPFGVHELRAALASVLSDG
jgi:hypothetical protein